MTVEPIEDSNKQHDDIATLELLLVGSNEGRARNGRGWFFTTCALLVVSIVAAVAIRGWSSTSSALESRNKAVAVLATDLASLNERSLLSGKVASCARDALATAFDDAIARDNYIEGQLLSYYERCEQTDGRTFLPE